MAFATVGELESYLQRDFSVDEALTATQALNVATQFIKDYTEQELEAVNGRVVTLRARRGVWLLPEIPVRNITEVKVGGEAFTDFDVDKAAGIIERTDASWESTDEVQITYDSGYTSIPASIKGVCLRWAGMLMANPTGLETESLGTYRASWPESQHDLKILDRFRA